MARLSVPTAAPKKPQTKPVKTGFGGSAGSNTSAAVRDSKSSNAPPATSRRASNKTSARAIRNSSISAKDYSSLVQVAIKLYEIQRGIPTSQGSALHVVLRGFRRLARKA